jgi:ATP-binding cassette subfamily C protein CydC
VFTGLSFHIAAGECVALKGASGSGKSTIAQLLVRLVPPRSGTIRVNGVDISTVAGSELHQRVALMTQDAPVFNDSVRANLLIGRSDATDRELWDVLRRVDLATAIALLPRGLETVLGEAGYTLSVGQARRICLARTLLSTASIVVLDEPTSGLDRDLEAAFLADLPGAASGRTTIVVTHADVPPGFDRVLHLRRGHLEEDREH